MPNTGRRKRLLDGVAENIHTKKHKSDFVYSSSESNETTSDSDSYSSQDIKQEKVLTKEVHSLERQSDKSADNVVPVDTRPSNANTTKSTSIKSKKTTKKIPSDTQTYNEVLDFQRITKPSAENIKLPNIYSSSNLEVLSRGTLLYGRRFKNNETERLVDNAIVPKLKPEFEILDKYKRPTGISQVEYKPPDEVLTNDYDFEANELVYLNRDEIKRITKVDLPRQDITNAIHYYVAQRIKTRFNLSDHEYDEKFSRIFDGSSLLALSTVFTNWVNELCGEHTYKAYMETTNPDNTKLSSIDEFIRVYDESSSDNTDISNSEYSDDSSDEEIEQSDSASLSDEESKFKNSIFIKKEEDGLSDES